MTDKVFLITGNKISSFVADDDSLKFSSQRFSNVTSFLEAWKKKLLLATKVEVKYNSIKSIKKEENDKDIVISYKTWAGIPGNCEFSFADKNDYDVFFNFLEKERYFTKTHETLTPFKAITNYAIGLAVVIAITIFSYYHALAIADGTAEETGSGRAMAFNYLVGFLGGKGVIAVGSLIALFLLYKMWTRFSKPPDQVRFLPPGA